MLALQATVGSGGAFKGQWPGTSIGPQTRDAKTNPAALHQSSFRPAQAAFERAQEVLKHELAGDEKANDLWIFETSNIHDVRAAASAAQEAYEQSGGKLRPYTFRLVSQVDQFAKILDLFTTYYPVYASLAYGAMRFLFQAVISHQDALSQLVEAYSEIAEDLPCLEVSLEQYPSDNIVSAVSELYALVMKFFVKAIKWYCGGRLRRWASSLGHPGGSQFSSLRTQIRHQTRHIEKLVRVAVQAELREMHLTLVQVKEIVTNSNSSVSTLMSLAIDTNMRVTDIQLSEILTFTASTPIQDHFKSLQYATYRRQLNRQKQVTISDPFWFSPKFPFWANSSESALILVRGSLRSMCHIQDFSTDLVQLLQTESLPVVWMLAGPKDNGVSMVDVIKFIVGQVLRLNEAKKTELSCANAVANFKRATTEADWFNVLGSVLEGLRMLYLIVDVNAVSNTMPSLNNFSLVAAFFSLFDSLKARGTQTVLKVALVSYGPSPALDSAPSVGQEDVTVAVRKPKVASKTQRRRAKFAKDNSAQRQKALRSTLSKRGQPGGHHRNMPVRSQCR